MTAGEQQDAFQNDLLALISRYKNEFNLSIASAMGVLELVKLDLWNEQQGDEETL